MPVEDVFVLGEGGVVIRMTPPLPEAIQDRIDKGYLALVNEDGTPADVDSEPVEPATAASKAKWVGWAVHNGMTPDDAEAMTKTDLIEKFGSV